MRFQLTYEAGAKTGNDAFALRLGGVDLIVSIAAPNTLTSVIASYRRIGTVLRRNYTLVGTGMSVTNPGPTNISVSSDVGLVSRLTAASATNSISLRRFAMWRE